MIQEGDICFIEKGIRILGIAYMKASHKIGKDRWVCRVQRRGFTTSITFNSSDLKPILRLKNES